MGQGFLPSDPLFAIYARISAAINRGRRRNVSGFRRVPGSFRAPSLALREAGTP
jgi:hypothetical protein